MPLAEHAQCPPEFRPPRIPPHLAADILRCVGALRDESCGDGGVRSRPNSRAKGPSFRFLLGLAFVVSARRVGRGPSSPTIESRVSGAEAHGARSAGMPSESFGFEPCAQQSFQVNFSGLVRKLSGQAHFAAAAPSSLPSRGFLCVLHLHRKPNCRTGRARSTRRPREPTIPGIPAPPSWP